MATTVGLHARLTANVDKFEKAMDQVTKHLDNVDRSTGKAAGSLGLLAKIEIGRLIWAGLTKIFDIMKKVAATAIALFNNVRQAVGAIQQMADATGFAVEPLQVFMKVAQDNGVSSDKFGEAIKRMTKRLAEAAQGFGEAKPALERLGLDITALARMKPEQAFLKIGEAIGKLPSKGDQAATAFKIFSDQGLAMVPMFKDLTKNVKGTADEMDALGQILTGDQTSAVESMNVAFKNVYSTGQKIMGQVIGNMAPLIEAATEKLLDFVRAFQFGGETGGNAVAKAITVAFIEGAKAFAGFADKLVANFTSFIEGLSGFQAGLVSIARDLGFTTSESKRGKLFEGTIADIDKELRRLQRHYDNYQRVVDDSMQFEGAKNTARKKQIEIERMIASKQKDRQYALEQISKSEKDYHAEKNKSLQKMGGFTGLIAKLEADLAEQTGGGGMAAFFAELGNGQTSFEKLGAAGAAVVKEFTGLELSVPNLGESVGAAGKAITQFLTDPSKAVGSVLGKVESGFWKLTEPLGLTPGILQTFADRLMFAGSPLDLLGQAGQGVLGTFEYIENNLGADLVGAANKTAQGFLDLLEPMGYTKDAILRMAAAAKLEEDYKKSLITNAMNGWDTVAKKMAAQYIAKGENPFDVYRAMMKERNEVLGKVTTHFDGLQKSAKKVGDAMTTLGPSMDTIAEGIPKAVELAGEKINEVTQSIADYFGIGEDGAPPEQPEEKDYTETLSNSETLLGTIADSVSGLGGLSLAKLF